MDGVLRLSACGRIALVGGGDVVLCELCVCAVLGDFVESLMGSGALMTRYLNGSGQQSHDI